MARHRRPRPARKPVVIPGHRISWFVWAGGQKMPRTATMRGAWGWDAACSCGWESRTGGATKTSVDRDVWGHKFDVADEAGRDLLIGVVR